ncbi:MAG: hypothetical protein KIS92_21625 [Planctomycetota bacterium]|nr:hypothetical protein [Planctomycetota bacterium]
MHARVFLIPVLMLALWGFLREVSAAEEAPPPLIDANDPGAMSEVVFLGLDEEKRYRELFEKLPELDFEGREAALTRLVARGPAILPLAARFAQSKDPEVAAMVANLEGRILLKYDGYLLPDARLAEALERPLNLKLEAHATALDVLQRIAKEQAFTLLFDQRYKPEDFDLPPHVILTGATVGRAVEVIAGACNLIPVVRGKVLLLTSPEVALRLTRQRHSFEWKDLGLDRAEAARIGEAFQGFFPGVVTELHTGSDALSVRGPVGCIAKAARLVEALKPGADSVQWPAPTYELDPAATLARFEKPVSVGLNRDDLTYAIQDFKKAGIEVAAVAEKERATQAPWPKLFGGLSPVTLTLENVPLGLAMRWLVKRAAFPGGDASVSGLYAEADGQGRVQFRIGSALRDVTALSVGACDAGFLKPLDAALPVETTDKAVMDKIRNVLFPHLLLFPDFDARRDLVVLRGRMIVQGSPAVVAASLNLMQRWRKDGVAPVCAWYQGMQERLDAKVDWDGRGLTGGKLLRRLREIGQCPLLLEDAPDGSAAHFTLKNEDAQLLPPGPHTLRELLDDLAAKAGAKWEVQWGAIVLTPAPSKPHPPPAPNTEAATQEKAGAP